MKNVKEPRRGAASFSHSLFLGSFGRLSECCASAAVRMLACEVLGSFDY